jgi:RNA-directed DNA polymerase
MFDYNFELNKIKRYFCSIKVKKKLIKYSEIISITNLSEGLKRTRGSASPGLDGEVKATFTEKKIINLHNQLVKQNYKPRPARRVNIPKPDGGTRPLGIASQVDNVVQAAILNLLEPALEKTFLDSSYGFRPGRNCHMALKEIKKKWQSVTWIINIDVAKYFDTVNHEILLEELKEYLDQPSCELIRKLLKAGYINLKSGESVFDPIIGTPQGSLISPLLANLYLHALDKHVDAELKGNYTRGDERKFVSGYQHRKYITAEQKKLIEDTNIPGLIKAAEQLKHNTWVKDELPSRDPHDEGFRRLYYVRYADDFIIGFSGPKK